MWYRPIQRGLLQLQCNDWWLFKRYWLDKINFEFFRLCEFTSHSKSLKKHTTVFSLDHGIILMSSSRNKRRCKISIIAPDILAFEIAWCLSKSCWPFQWYHLIWMTSLKLMVASGNIYHGDVIKWKHFLRYWPFVRGIYRSPVNSPHKGQWHGALIFSLICAWKNDWVNNREAGDLGRHRAHYDVTVMHCCSYYFCEVGYLQTQWGPNSLMPGGRLSIVQDVLSQDLSTISSV